MNDRDLLFYLVKRVRRDVDGQQWDDTTEHQRGLMKHLQPVADLDPELWPFERKAQAVMRYAADAGNHTPKNLADTAGPHWRTTAASSTRRPPRGDEQCPRHGKYHGHADCDGLAEIGDEPLDAIDLERAGLHPKDIAVKLAHAGRDRLHRTDDGQETA